MTFLERRCDRGPAISSLSPGDGPATRIVVVNHAGGPPDARTYKVPDPRKVPTSWPWANSLDDDDE
jgi:hypothetical protein